MADTENLSPALVNVLKELRRVVDVEIKSEVARRLADKDVSAAEISRLLGVSRTTVYRYLGPGWKRRTKAEAHQPAAGVADAAGHDLTDQPARLDRGP
jgi:DNA invertase Pin-like site-specific DNA recombinase